MLDLNEIATFVEVVRVGSFAEAGRRLGIPPATIGRHITQLETRLGVRLLHRSTRKLGMTNAGRNFFERCETAVTNLTLAGQDAMVDTRTPSGLVKVAAPAGFFDAFPVDWIKDFLNAHPQVRLQFVLSDEAADLISEGIDVAFRAGQSLDPDSVSRKILRQRFILVASPSYIQERGAPIDTDDLLHHDCIPLTTRSSVPPVWRLDGCSDIRISGRFSANTARAVLRAALAGLGITMLPEVVVAPDLQARRLLRVLPTLSREAGDVYVVLPSRRHIPSAVSAFVSYASGELTRNATRFNTTEE
ncbi:LysR family transcriptional regulator [Paraburkholderia xenovorans]|uniref:LysR family transcriptional regulator n=1 Tax=Paraburkholderia xenovorans TaxID=36873 RepID=UPI0038BD49B8